MTDSLSILQVNTHDLGGGAERVTMDLHSQYSRRGLDAWVAVGEKLGNDPCVVEIPNDAQRSGWTRAIARTTRGADSAASRAKLIASDPARYSRILRGREDYDFPASRRLKELVPNEPDVLHLHNLHGYYFDLRALPALASTTPTIITMHDAWLLTGHCAHPFDCERWRTGCGDCPDLGMYVPIARDSSARNRREKFDILGRSGALLATPSEWLMRLVRESGAAELVPEVRVIPNGVDTEVFSPGDRDEARIALDLPLDRRIVLVAANILSSTNPFKDYPTLLESLPILAEQHPGTLVVVLGAHHGDIADVGVEVVARPFVASKNDMARHYRAADVYAHVARAENLPLSVIEASACGAAVVASDVGGVSEIVDDGVSGDLVVPRDPVRLAAALGSLLGDERRVAAYGDAGRARVLDRFTLERQADAYLSWFAELV